MTKELISKLRELSDRVFHGDTKPGDFRIIDRAADALAAVPDAATERVTENSVRHVKRLTTELQNKREALNDQRREYRALLSKRDRTIDGLRAERDAALAAVERVRALVTEWKHEGPSGPFPDRIAIDVGVEVIEPLLAALDGAPEPETAPENYEPKCNGACAVHGSPVTNWPVQYGRRNRETGALHWLKGDPFDSWWHENQDRYEHVKRYTSPPLPVEGESNA